MIKDRLILLALLTGILAVAACDVPWDHEKEKKRLPDRAPAANPLLRHYYDTLTFPSKMTAIKIPEGDEFDDKEASMTFNMGGGEVVNDVRIRLYMLPPADESESHPDVRVKVIAPDGTASAWTEVSFVSGAGDSAIVDLNAEVHFAVEFDGTSSDGEWEIQLRDPIEDEDGRCILRNATLRLNLGLPAGSTFGNESSPLPLVSGMYGTRLPEFVSPRVPFDLGHIGANKPLILPFTITNSFAVTGLTFSWTIRSNFAGDPTTEMFFYIISPSGGWWCPSVKEVPSAGSVTDPTSSTDDKQTRYIFSMNQSDTAIGNSFPFLGEPSAGTWTVLLFDFKKDGLGHYLIDSDIVAAAIVTGVPATLELT